MNGIDWRLAYRLHRFELVWFAVVVAGMTAGALVLTRLMDATGYAALCPPVMAASETPTSPACTAVMQDYYGIRNVAYMLKPLAVLATVLFAAILGVSVIGREAERGTLRFAWSVAPSRTAWFARRVLPVLAVVLVAALALGAALDPLFAASYAGVDPWHAIPELGSRGPALAARVVLVFAVAVLAGALLGRALPALIVALVAALVAWSAVTYVQERILYGQATWIPSPSGSAPAGDLFLESGFLVPDGRIVDWQTAELLDPPVDGEVWEGPDFPMQVRTVPGTRYPEAVAREGLALGGGSLLALLATAGVLARRRPG